MRSGSSPSGNRTVPSGNNGSECSRGGVVIDEPRMAIIAFRSRPHAMLYQIPSFLLDVIVGLLGGACLLRLYMQLQRVPFGNPLGRFLFAVTDWIVLPLRRIVP